MRWSAGWLLSLLIWVGVSIGGQGIVDPLFASDLSPEPPQEEGEVPELKARFLFAVGGPSSEHPFASPMGIYVDRERGEVYVADTGHHEIDVFDGEGHLRQSGLGKGNLLSPFDLVVTAEGEMLVTQMDHVGIPIFDYRGRVLGMLAESSGEAAFRGGRLCRGVEGRLYVADRDRAQIRVFDREGRFLFRFGNRGRGPGQFRLISGIDADAEGRIYVADSKHPQAIQVFTADGAYLRGFGEHGPRREQFALPGGLRVDPRGQLWILDTFQHRVKRFQRDGRFVGQFGTFGPEPGKLFFPLDLDLDAEGHLFILEKAAQRFQVFEIEDW